MGCLSVGVAPKNTREHVDAAEKLKSNRWETGLANKNLEHAVQLIVPARTTKLIFMFISYTHYVGYIPAEVHNLSKVQTSLGILYLT